MRSHPATLAALLTTLMFAAPAYADDEDVSYEQLPPAVQATLAEEFPDATFVEAEFDEEDEQTVYDVELRGADGEEFDVELTAEGEILEVDVAVRFEDLPPAVQASLRRNFPDATYVEGERETDEGETVYEVELEQDDDEVEVVFAPDGTILEVDEDD